MSGDMLERLIRQRRWSRTELPAHLTRLLESTFAAPVETDAAS